MTDVTMREIQDLRELTEPPAAEPADAKAAGDELLAEARAMIAGNHQLLASLKAKRS
jgi:DNA-binding GntR family transcriptional regulator